tara:strand:+ start:203 stop:1288 length:1086 start_codon:yes stop_codon:yes gene_type:complete
MSIKKDKYYISLANNLALNSKGNTGSNPSVGVIVVKNDTVISYGITGINGRPHAEINALNNLSKYEKKNSTIYISLEPCSHYGKTPPCVNKIIKSKIKRVVYSINDIDIRTARKAYKILKSKKIKVKSQLLKNISKNIYKNYFYSKKKEIPYVYGKLAISKDCYIKDKKNFYITNDHSRKTTHVLRSKVNCILTTYKTINSDNPQLNCRIMGLNKFSPQVAILDKNLNTKKNSFLVANAKKNKTFLFYNKQNKKNINYLKAKKIKLIYTPLYNGELDFNFILKKLYKYEISSVLIEGGKVLTHSLLENDFFNEFYLFIASKYLKNKGHLKVSNIISRLSTKFKNIKLNETFLDNDNLIHYY